MLNVVKDAFSLNRLSHPLECHWRLRHQNLSTHVDVLVITDLFTKLADAFPCENRKVKQVARKVWDHIFSVYDFPVCIQTYQGANFESGLIAKLLKLSGVYDQVHLSRIAMGN